jgi:hypothetical protein
LSDKFSSNMRYSFFINFGTLRAVHCTYFFIHMKGMNPHLTNGSAMFCPGAYFEERREWCDGKRDDDNDFLYGFDDVTNNDNLDG